MPPRKPSSTTTTAGQPYKLRDVARAAGVHSSTASRALDSELSARLSDEVVQRVRQAARDMGYSPNMLAASLRTQRSRTIGVIVPDLTNTMFPPMFRGIEDRVNNDGYSAVLANSDLRDDKERKIFETFVDRRLDGMIVATATLDSFMVKDAVRRRMPLVLLNRTTSDDSISVVVADEKRGITLAVQHLLSLGHRRIAHLAAPQDISTGRIRREAFLAAMNEAGVAVDDAFVIPADKITEEDGKRSAKILLESTSRPTAIVAANDTLAIGAIIAAEEINLSCPTDMSVTGFNDMPYSERMRPPLTTVRIPHYQMGFEAGDELMHRLKNPSAPPKRRVLEPALIVRSSTRALSNA